ncbi:MAG: hypothetical protein EOM80_02560 [Erysipelotrichia bacterium]|nr:hypothetical protein [Erysipelotrichia bacterium]
MFNPFKIISKAILYAVFFVFTASCLLAQHISGARFDYNFPPCDSKEERQALENAFERLKLKNPDLTGLSDEVIRKGSEKDVERVFRQLESAKKQYESASSIPDKTAAYQVLNNYNQLYRAYRTLISSPANKPAGSISGQKTEDNYGVYDNSRTPFCFLLKRAELTPEGPVIEFEYTFDRIDFFADFNVEKLGQLGHDRPWALNSISVKFLANNEEIRPFGNPEKPANGKSQLKQKYEELGTLTVKAANLTNSFFLDYGDKYAAKVKIAWPLPPEDELKVITIKEGWTWRPPAKKNFSNEYRIIVSIPDGGNRILHEELVTMKTGDDYSGAQVEHKSLVDSSSIMWGLGGVMAGLGLLGMFKLGKTGTPGTENKPGAVSKTPVIEQKDLENTEEEKVEGARLIFDTSGCSLVIVTETGNAAEFSARVVDSEVTGWQLQSELLSGEGLLKIEQKSASSTDLATYSVKEIAATLQPGENVKEFALHVVARHETRTISKVLDIVVGREGMFILSGRPLKITADAESTADLKITAIEFSNGYLATDHNALINLDLSFEADDDLARKAFETCGVDFRADSEWENVREATDAYQRSNVFAALVLHAKTARALPSQKNNENKHNLFTGRLKIVSRGGKRPYEQVIPVELHVPAEPARAERLQQEYANCKIIIERYVPQESGYQQKFLDMLQKFGPTMGPEGLYKLRHDIWTIAQKLWEAKGLQGYVEISERLETYDKLRNWAEWSGDIALSVLLYCKTGGGLSGTLSQTAITMLKQLLVSGINHYKDTVEINGRFSAEDCEAWVNNQLKQQLFSTPDYMLTAASLKGFIEPGRAAVLMFVNVFLRSLITGIDWAKMGENWDESGLDHEARTDICKAAWIATQECFKALGTMAVTNWLTGATVRSAIKNKVQVHDDVLKQYGKDALIAEDIPLKKTELYDPHGTTDVVNDMSANIKNGKADPDDVVKCLADNKTQAMRTIKNLPEPVQKAFMNTLRKEFYEPHDRALIKHLEAQTNVPWGTKIIDGKPAKTLIKVFETSTPGKKTVFSQDRDFCPKYYDVKTQQWLEIIPDRHWKGVSNSWWKNKTGFEAEKLQQAAMTRLGDEACPDYASQRLNTSTGLYEVVEPNIIKVYEGKATLKSPVELAAMYKNKIEGPLKHGNQAESIAQLKKGVQVYDKLIKGYKKQGLLVNSPEPQFKLAMEMISWAPDDFKATPEVISRLNKLLAENTGFNDFQSFGLELVVRLGRF